jgi:molybdopterin-guanine dinucleotide biosynthesis protein A
MHDLSAFVLAGGRSSRLGRDKALLAFGHRNFLEIALDNARAVCPDPIIVGPRSLYASYGPVVEDRVAGCGPLGGIHSALSATTSDLNLILSVDMPLMDPGFLGWLSKIARQDDRLVTLPRSGERRQPLCAVYRRGLLPHIEAALARKQYKVEAAFATVPARVVQEDEITSAGFTSDIFSNINRPCEYESLTGLSLAELASAKGPQR